MIFHLTNINVGEVSLVDHGAIDHDFTGSKSAQKNRWFIDTLKRAVESAKISVEDLADKTGIDSKELGAISAGSKQATGDQLAKIAEALGLKGALNPTKEADNMNEEAIKKLVSVLLAPLTKALEGVKESLTAMAEKQKSLEEGFEKAVSDAGKSAPVLSEEAKAEAKHRDADIKQLKEDVVEIEKQTISALEDLSKCIGASSQKIADNGGGDEGKDANGKKRFHWKSFAAK